MVNQASVGSFSFAESLVAALSQQRSSLPANGQKNLCDVIVRSGGIATQAHSSVLSAVSRYFDRLLSGRSSQVSSVVMSSLVTIDVSTLFRNMEALLPLVIESLYTGVQLTSPVEATELCLAAAYKSLELKLPFVKPQLPLSQKAMPPPPDIQMVSLQQPDIVASDTRPDDAPQETKVENNNVVSSSSGGGSDLACFAADDVAMDISMCSKCNMLFVSKDEFLAHAKVKCGRRLTCYSCGKMFPRVQGLVSHLLDVRHGETVCSICGHNAESQFDAEQHIAKHASDPENPYFCVSCDSRFSTRKKWEKHLPKHSLEAPYVCTTCGKAFKWKHALVAHAIVHSKEKKFLCQQCGFTTSHVSTFRFHARKHTGNLMKCDVENCTFQTTRKTNLVQHKLTHSKEKPHQCEVCGRAFSLAKNMRRHARQHDTSATVYTCKSCSFSSLRSDKYLEHVKKYHPDDEAEQQGLANLKSEKDERVVSAAAVATADSIVAKPQAVVIFSTSPFNTVNPPNKTVSDTYEAEFSEANFDEANFDSLAAIVADRHEEISQLVSLPL